jgi:hypothetical protein
METGELLAVIIVVAVTFACLVLNGDFDRTDPWRWDE